MGKRSNFERKERDYYSTPIEAVLPLLRHLPAGVGFMEPCAGDGRMIRHLEKYGHKCLHAFDIEPQAEGIEKKDVLFFGEDLPSVDMIITNPPWERELLHQMIERFRMHAPTWLLFDAGWMFTVQAAPYIQYCSMIVAIGRVKWIEGTDGGGKEDAAWYRFEKNPAKTIFVGKSS